MASGLGRGVRAASATVFCAIALSALSARAEVVEASPDDDIESMINELEPGDELVLSGGVYTLEEKVTLDVVGTEDAPIVIRAKEGERPNLDRPLANENIVDIQDAQHVTIRGIEFSGGSAGVRIVAARFLTIEDCEIRDTGDVALRANDSNATYDSLRILRNHIHHTNNTGEGMYLGCNNGDCEVIDSLIEGNYVHHTNQPSVDQGDGIELKEGSFGNVIRDNVIHDTHYPCILTYAANGPPNVIERNLMWNCGDHAIQSAADAIIRNNIVLSANQDGIRMQPHQAGAPSNLVVTHNTVLQSSGDAIRVSGATGSVVVANNALYAQSGRAFSVGGEAPGLVFEGNVGAGGTNDPQLVLTSGNLGTDFVAASFAGAPPIDVFPVVGSALIGAGSLAYLVDYDFNGTPRADAVDAGAYVYSVDGNPGWSLAAAFKAATPGGETPGADGSPGTGGAAGARDGSGGTDAGSGAGEGGGSSSSGCNVSSSANGSAFGLSWLAALTLLLRLRYVRRPSTPSGRRSPRLVIGQPLEAR